MARRLPDFVQIVVLAAGPRALLRRGGTHVVAFLQAEEDILELIHPGVGKKQARVISGQERA